MWGSESDVCKSNCWRGKRDWEIPGNYMSCLRKIRSFIYIFFIGSHEISFLLCVVLLISTVPPSPDPAEQVAGDTTHPWLARHQSYHIPYTGQRWPGEWLGCGCHPLPAAGHQAACPRHWASIPVRSTGPGRSHCSSFSRWTIHRYFCTRETSVFV